MDFLNKVSFVFFNKYIGLPIELITSVLIVRYLGPDDYGQYVILFLIPLLIGSLGSLGFGPSIVYSINNKEEYFPGYLLTFTTIGIVLGILYSGILLSIFDYLNSYIYENRLNKKLFLIALIFIPAIITQKFLRAILRGLYNIKVFSLVLDIFAPLIRIIIVFIVLKLDYGLVGIVWVPVLVQSIITAYLFFYLLVKYEFNFAFISKSRLNVIFKFAIKNYIGTALQKSHSSFMMIIASSLLSFKDVGLLSLAQKLITMVTSLSSAVLTVLMPKISRSNYSEIKIFITKITSFMFVINIGVFIIYFICLEFLVKILYGYEFIGISHLSAPLCISSIFLIFANILLIAITFTGDPIKKAYARGFGFFVNLVVFYPLFLIYGVLGLVISIAIGQVFTFLLSLFFFSKRFKDVHLRKLFIPNINDLHQIIKILKNKSVFSGKSSKNIDLQKYSLSMQNVACPLCQSNDKFDLTRLFSTQKTPVSICKNCSLVFLNPRNTEKWYEEYYRNSNFQKINRVKRGEINLYESNQYKRGKRIFEYVCSYSNLNVTDMCVLEIGCTSGGILRYFRDQGVDKVTGVDPEKKYVNYANSISGIKVHGGFLREFIENSNEKFNVIILRHVLEHMPDPLINLAYIRSLLSDNGFLYVETPSLYSMGIDKKWKENFIHEHPIIFSNQTLKYILLKSKFKIIREPLNGNRSHLNYLVMKSNATVNSLKYQDWRKVVLKCFFYDTTTFFRRLYYRLRSFI